MNIIVFHYLFFFRRILCAFAACKPQIGYCQSLNFIAGFLFLVLQTEERAFRAMVQLLDSPDEDVGLHVADYYSPGLTGLRRDIQVVTILLRKRLPAVLDKLDVGVCSIRHRNSDTLT